MPLSFPRQVESAVPPWVEFPARDRSRLVFCRISFAALKDHFGLTGTDPRQAITVFRAHRRRIETRALRKYDAGQIEYDGSVVLDTADF